MNQDFLDLLRAFIDHSVRFLIVGATGRAKDLGDIEALGEAATKAGSG
jgi:hypothetical protein